MSSGDEAEHRSILYSADSATNPDGSPIEDIEEAALLSELQRVQRDIATRRADRRRRLELQLLQARRELEAEQREDMAIFSSSPLATTSGNGHRVREDTHRGPRRRVSPARAGAQFTRHTSPGRYVPEASRRSPTDAALGGDSQAVLNAGSDTMRQSRPRGGDAEISRHAGHSAQAGGRHDLHLSGDRPQGRARAARPFRRGEASVCQGSQNGYTLESYSGMAMNSLTSCWHRQLRRAEADWLA